MSTMYVQIIGGENKNAGIEIGDIFEATRYWLDPLEKFILIKKIFGSKTSYEERSKTHYSSDLKYVTREEIPYGTE